MVAHVENCLTQEKLACYILCVSLHRGSSNPLINSLKYLLNCQSELKKSLLHFQEVFEVTMGAFKTKLMKYM